MTFVAIVLLGLMLPPVLFDLFRRPTIRRLGLRNVSRRRGEAALVIGGSLLATALITASFVVGDSFGNSIRNLAQDRWGPTDMLVIVDDRAAQSEAVERIEASDSANIDGVLPVSFVGVAMGAGDVSQATRKVEPRVRLLELDPGAGSVFGGDAQATGLASVPTQLGPQDVILNAAVAGDLDVVVGDTIDIYAGNQRQEFQVVSISERTGLAGIGEAIVAPGSVTDALLSDSGLGAADAIQNVVFVSNTGDVFAGAERSDDVREEIETALAGLDSDLDIEAVKQHILEDAEAESAETTELFGTIGGFSVAAGILLVINLFVMLAAERTVELGTMRAVGMRRGAVMRSFALEGAVYGVVAAMIGALVGVLVGAGVTAYASRTLGEDGFSIGLHVKPMSLLSGAAIGLAISQITVLATSARTSKLNIVRALRDLPAQKNRDQTWKGLVGGGLGVVAAVAAYVLAGTTPIIAMAAPVAGLVAAIPILSRFVPGRLAIVALCGAALFWAAAVFGLLPDVMEDPDISLFLLQGVLLVGLAVSIAAVLDGFWSRIARIGGGANVASRVGLAHPLDRPVRSALLVAMYALVIFTVTFMGVMNSVFSASTPELATQAGGEWDIVLDTNETSPFEVEELLGRTDVAFAAPVISGGLEVALREGDTDAGDDEARFLARGDFVDARFTGVSPPPLFSRDPSFADDAAAWQAMVDGEAGEMPWVVIPDWYDETAGDVLTLVAEDGTEFPVRVAGETRNGWLVGAGIFLSQDLTEVLGTSAASADRFYLAVSDGLDAGVVADSLNADGAERGTNATSLLEQAINETGEQEAFIAMLQGYLGLGLLIGIAGLGVVLVRAVRERRRQLGMMRAVGIPAQTVRRSFMVEAAFIGLQGVGLGIGLGVLSSWQTLTRSTAFEEGLTFALPVAWLAVLAAIAVGASLLAAVVPAMRAGRVPPASALRITG